MIHKIKTLFALILLASICYGQQVPTDELIRSIFNTAPSSMEELCETGKTCVNRHLCTENNTLNVFGGGLIGIRINADDNEDCGYLKVCCNSNNTEIDSNWRAAPAAGCGYRNKNGVKYTIIDVRNNEAEFSEFPWMVAIMSKEHGKIIQSDKCGGALVAPNVVVTAAHCIETKTRRMLVVRAGEWDMGTTDEFLPYQERQVLEIIVHENYNNVTLFNDIAILIVESPFVWEENVRSICLPPEGSIFDGSNCFATGWGKETFEGRSYKMILKKISLPVVPRNICVANLRTTRLGNIFQLHESFICAGGKEGEDTCKGDGGSPLVCPIPGYEERFYHAGIVAWGIGCGNKNIPGVYADVAHLRAWINLKLTSRGIDFKHFTA